MAQEIVLLQRSGLHQFFYSHLWTFESKDFFEKVN